MDIYYSRKFAKEYKKLPLVIKLKAEKKETLFRKDPHHLTLKTHKLSGELKDFSSFSVDYQYRIVFHYEIKDRNQIVIFDTIGTHAIYK